MKQLRIRSRLTSSFEWKIRDRRLEIASLQSLISNLQKSKVVFERILRKSVQQFVLGLVALLVWALPAAAQTAVPPTAPPPILRNDLSVNYPNDARFTLTLPPDTAVTQADLIYGLDRLSCLDAAARVPVELVATADGLTADWTWVMARSGNPPPGAALWWEWRLTDANGEQTTTPRQSYTFQDDRFTWRSVSADRLTLHWYRGDVGPLLLEAAVAGLEQLETDMGISLQDEVQIYVYGSAADMRQAVLYVQDWAGGLAFSDYGIILLGVLPASAAGWGRSVVRHELAHLVTEQFAFSCVGGRRPTWLEEGLAVYAEGELSGEMRAALDRAQAVDSFSPLRSLSGAFPAHSDRAGLAYAQSYSVVEFMLRAYGREKLQELLLALAAGQSSDAALEAVYGFNVDGLEAAWRRDRGLAERPFPPTPTPISPAAVPTIAPLGRPESLATPPPALPTPPAPAAPPASGSSICGLGLIPLLLVGLPLVRPHRSRPKRTQPL